MPFDYSSLFTGDEGHVDTWRDIYDESLSLPQNLLSILKRTIYLPHDFYDVIAAYFLLPSALCKVVPYLFLYGQSGSGKSTIAKIASYVHGVSVNSSADSFAGIRNSLEHRKYGRVEIYDKTRENHLTSRRVEVNTCMVWDDISSQNFTSTPELYNMFKFGYDRSSDKMTFSSGEIGQNMTFHCFCPKIFSSISPLHLDDRFKELRRRLIVIPCKRIEELPEKRLVELGITLDTWQQGMIDLTAYDWKGFASVFDEFWDLSLGQNFVTARKLLSGCTGSLNSQQRTISLDLMAAGIASGVWTDENEAISRLKTYWSWFLQETGKDENLEGLLKKFISQENKNARNGGRSLEISTAQIRGQIDMWHAQGWVYEKPKPGSVKATLLELGLRLKQGKWVKG